MTTNHSSNKGLLLIFWGIALFLSGLIVGLLIPILQNPRMGLSTHLEGVLNGMFLVAIGLIWEKMTLNKKQRSWLFSLLLYGSFANFLAVFIGATTGGGKLMPIANGQDKGPFVEAVISFLLISLSLAMLIACLLILLGLYKSIRNSTQ